MQGLPVDTYRNKYDCTNGGVSSKYDEFILVGKGIPEIFETNDKTLALKLVERTIGGARYLHAEPIESPRPGCVGWMFGGNFIWTSDSRFPNRYPISIHDRQETQMQNEHLSR